MKNTHEAKRGKQPNSNLLLVLCRNAAEKPITIWKAQKLHCFKNIDVTKMGMIWKSNSNALTSIISGNVLHDFDEKDDHTG